MEDHRLNIATSLLAYAVQRDIDPAQVCALAGIDFPAIRDKAAISITAPQLNELWRQASRLTHDPLFGLHLGESLQLSALGIVGEIIKSSSTVGAAVTQAAALAHLFTDLFYIDTFQNTDSFTVQFTPFAEPTPEQAFAFRQTMDLFMVFVVHELDGLMLAKIKPLAVYLPYAVADRDLKEYERVFRCRPVKKAGIYQLQFSSSYYQQPVITANYELQSLLLQKVNSTLPENTHPNSLQARIYNYLLANAYLGIASLDEIAANFNVSTRSLQRRLKEEGSNFQQIAEKARKSLALHYLDSGNYQFKEISYMLGYNELSAFSRAFKRWTGSTPLSYQKRA